MYRMAHTFLIMHLYLK